MARVTGVGGIFWKVADPKRTAAWYRETLDIGGEWGVMLPWSIEAGNDAYSLVSHFPQETEYLNPSPAQFMVNLRVDDLDAMVSELEAKGIEILGGQEEEYGKFAWILDCDGVKIELWQQAGEAPPAT